MWIATVAGAFGACTAVVGALGQDGVRTVQWPTADRPAYPSSPYHGAIDGDGRVIPCRCRFQGREFRLGELACMSTPTGTVLTRCDLLMNNTSWVPTETPCTVSQAPAADGATRLAAGGRE
jgi:hypothetical protein